MKKLFLFCLLGVLITACSKDEGETNYGPVRGTYELKSIEYYLDEGDGIDTSVIDLKKHTFENPSGVITPVKISPLKGTYETSHFYQNDFDIFPLLQDTVWVQTPSAIIDDNIFKGSSEWVYAEYDQLKDAATGKEESSANIAPFTKLESTGKAKMVQYTVSYSIKLVKKSTSEEITVNGKWKGSVLRNPETVFTFTEL